jgi:hypothetical protein
LIKDVRQALKRTGRAFAEYHDIMFELGSLKRVLRHGGY